MTISIENELIQTSNSSVYNSLSEEEKQLLFSESYTNLRLSENMEMKPNVQDVNLTVKPKLTTKKHNSIPMRKYLVIPQKLDQPLYVLPDFILGENELYFENLSAYDNTALKNVYEFSKDRRKISGIIPLMKFYEILETEADKQNLNDEIIKFADTITKDEIYVSSIMEKEVNLLSRYPDLSNKNQINKRMTVISFFHMMRIKFMLEYGRTKDKVSSTPFTNVYEAHVLYDENRYIVTCRIGNFKFEIMVNQKYFCVRFENLCIINYAAHFNYLVTIADTKFVMSIIMGSSEYSNVHNFINDVENKIQYLKEDGPNLVKYMSTLESLMLYMIDMNDHKYCSQITLIDAIETLMDIFSVRKTENNVYLIWKSFLNLTPVPGIHDELKSLIMSLRTVKLKQLGTLSSIHKYMGISEIVYTKGWTKYHNRTGDRYKTKKQYMDKLVLLFRYEFVMGYYKANNELPKFKHENAATEKLRSLVDQHKSHAFTYLHQLSDWKDIDLEGVLVPCQFNDVTPSLKDKACTIDDYEPGKPSSIKELEAYLNQPDNKPEDILPIYEYLKKNKITSGRKHITTNNPDDVNKFIDENFKDRNLICTRLVAKEKEQKEEGRYFGIAPYKLKIALSRMMDLVKRAAKYFRDQIMTLTDTGRKNKIFEAGQTLLENDTYSLMLDISGHNQSMTRENCEPLLEEIMKLYGLHGYGKIAGIFEHLLVVQENKELGTFYVSTGQSGGIEGWMNQLWGLQSALIMRLFTFEHTLSTEHILTYSDDINAVFRLRDSGPQSLMMLFINCSNYYNKFGQLIKIKQTQVTGSRVTMLKNHYIHGYQSETTIKRIMAYTIMSNKYYYCEALEAETIGATTSSAIENTTLIYTTTLIKHILYILLGSATFLKHLMFNNNQEFRENLDNRVLRMLNTEFTIEENLRDLYNFNRQLSYSITISNNEKYYVDCKSGYAKLLDKNEKPITDQKIIDHVGRLIILSQYKVKKDIDILNYFFRVAHQNAKNHRMLWMLKLYSPISLGGYGAIPLQDQLITGHSESRPKIISFLYKLLNYYNIGQKSQEYYKRLIFQHYYTNNKADKQSLISSAFPTYNTAYTYKDIIKNEIILYLKRKNYNNKDIKQYIDLYDQRTLVCNQLIEINKSKFIYRIVRKYLDCSHVTLIEQFIQKLEHSNTIFKLCSNNIQSLITGIFFTSISAQNMLYQSLNIKHLKYTTCNPEYMLSKIKIQNYPDITFNDVLEPTYDHSLIEQKEAFDILIETGYSKRITKGGFKYHEPVYNKSVKPKYQLKYEMNYYFTSPAEHRIFEITRFTKWVLHTSSIYKREKIKYSNNITNNANYILSYYTSYRYKDLEKYVLTPNGGQIFHRTDNQGFKSSSAVKIAPNLSGVFVIEFSDNYVSFTGGTESNVNYDYLRCRLISMCIMRSLYFSIEGSIGFVTNKNYIHTTEDVQRDFTVRQKELIFKHEYNPFTVVIREERFLTFEAISELLSNGLDFEDIDLNALTLLEKLPGMEELDKQLYTLYRDIKLFLNINNYVCYEMLDNEIKMGFLSIVDQDYYMNRYGTVWNLVEMDKFITESMSNERERYILYQGSLEKKTIEYIHRIYEKRLNALQRMAYNVYSFKSLLKVRNFFRSAVLLLIVHHFIIFRVVQEGDHYLVQINRDATKKHYLTVLNDQNTNVIGISNIGVFKKMFEIFNAKYFTQDIDCIMDKLILESKTWKINAIRTDFELESDSITERFYVQSKPTFYKFEYNISEFNPFELELLDSNRNTIEWYSRTIKNHCSLKASSSPTGAQSLQAQYNLLRCLSNIDFEYGMVLDLCAGRGDGHMALTELHIPHKSISRNDIYDRISCVEGIHIDENLNILDYKTLSNYINANTYLMDISYIKGEGDIWETVCFLLAHNKNIIIRMNHLNSPTKNQIEFIAKYKTYMCKSEQSRDATYQIYLVITNKRTNMMYHEVKKNVENFIDKLRYDTLNFRKYDVFDIDEKENIVVDNNMYIDKHFLLKRQSTLVDGFIEEDQYYKTQVYSDILNTCIAIIDNANLLNYEPILNFRPKGFQTMLILETYNNDGSIVYKLDQTKLKESSLRINYTVMEKAIKLKDVKIDNINRQIETYKLGRITSIRELNDYIELCKVSQIPKDYYNFIMAIYQYYLESGVTTFKLSNLLKDVNTTMTKIGFHLEILEDYKVYYQQIIDALIIAKARKGKHYLRQAYMFVKHQLGRGKTSDEKMSRLLFFFRCIANKIHRSLHDVDTTSWFTMTKLQHIGKPIKLYEEDDLTSSDYTPIEEFLSKVEIDMISSMFSFDIDNNKVSTSENIESIEELKINIMPRSDTGINIMQDLFDISEYKDAPDVVNPDDEEVYEEDYIDYSDNL